MSVFTYAADEVRIIVGGVPISGLADGTFVTVESDEQRYNKVTGADGVTSRARTGNRAGTITITLQQTSPSNAVLTGIMLADERDNEGVVNVLIRDSSGSDLHAADSAWVQQPPPAEYGKEVGDREWVLDCGRIDSFLGGNREQTGGSV